MEAIAAQLKGFRAVRVSGLVIDITDNGGGNDWVVDIARFLYPGALSCPAGVVLQDAEDSPG